MTFGKRIVAPSKDAQAEQDACPQCRGAGTIRGRGQRKVCVPCKGTGKKSDAS
jgi:DnaJ-class molecular chaperone